MQKINSIEINSEQVEDLRARLKAQALEKSDYTLLDAFVQSHSLFQQALQEKNITISKLRSLFGKKTEKVEKASPQREKGKKQRKNGHRRECDYPNAKITRVAHESLKQGDTCPKCLKGRLYSLKAGSLIHIVGQIPYQVEIYKPERLRCALCGYVFTAKLPSEVQKTRSSHTAKANAVFFKYRMGLPFYRQATMQRLFGMPITASEICKMTKEVGNILEPIFLSLIREAAQGHTVHNDDTTARILDLIKENKKVDKNDTEFRKGIFTSAILSKIDGKTIALYFTGRKHAGENLEKVLDHRKANKDPPIQMCDALSRNKPCNHKTKLSNCLAHCRRKFYELLDFWPKQLLLVMEWFRQVFDNEAQATERGLSSEKRLIWHQVKSTPIMHELYSWCNEMIEEKKVEPNSNLGKAIQYTLKHWEGLTLFLRVAGAPLSNNDNERQIKTAVLNRKNSYFFKTENGANIGDIHLSIIETCDRNGINPWEYLVTVQKYQSDISHYPKLWFPWNYQERWCVLEDLSIRS